MLHGCAPVPKHEEIEVAGAGEYHGQGIFRQHRGRGDRPGPDAVRQA